MKFFLGFLAGALVIIGVQLRYAPIPTPANEMQPTRDVTSATSADGAPGTIAPADSDRDTNSNAPAVAVQTRRHDTPEPAQTENNRRPNQISLPDTHAGFVAKDGPSLPDEHERLEREEVDSVWADQVRELIANHVANHRLGQSVFVVSLRCRTTRCEIAGTVFGDNGQEIWNTIASDMQTQTWFASFFEDSVYGAGGAFPGEYRFVTILARAGSQSTTPVSP